MTPIAAGDSKGFTLLEAIIALALISLALIPLLTFIAQSSDELVRAGESNERSFVMQSALALMDPINPMAESKGSLALNPNTSVSWSSEVAAKPNDGPLIGAGLTGFRLGFYLVHVTVARGNDPWFTFDMRKVGYEKLSNGMPAGGTE